MTGSRTGRPDEAGRAGPADPTTRDLRLLRSVVEELAPIPRLPTSAGERRAAELIRRRLDGLGCRAVVEETPARGSYAAPIGLLSAAAVAGALVAGRGHRVLGSAGAAMACLGIADDITGRWMLARRALIPPRRTSTVVAETGDSQARRVLCLLAHHDAAPSGVVFHQGIHAWLARRHPAVIERMTSNPPLWWPVLAGPAAVSLGSAIGSHRLRRAGLLAGLASLAAMLDIGRRPAVPGANDNLSGVAALVAVAGALQRDPVHGVRVLLVSAGAEEALQEGIRGFGRRHFPRLPVAGTWFLNLDTVGSGRLVLLEAEGPIRLRGYHPGFKDLVSECAAARGIPLIRGLRSRSSTDGSVPNRHGYRTATVVSVDERKLIPNYHLPSDLPQNLDYSCVLGAARLAEAVARRIASG